MRYILSCSGGKDSIATGIVALEKNEPLDTIIYSEVMYDKSRGISGEDPEHVAFVYNVVKPFFESRGIEFHILHDNSDYLTFFHHIITKATTYPEHNGMMHGFPLTSCCGIQRDLKVRPINRFLKTIEEPYVQYIGYAADETKRLGRLRPGQISLLEKYGVTEREAFEICEHYGLVSPLYRLSRRGGCWFCPNSKIEENEEFRARYPEIWEEFVSLEKERNLAFPVWNMWGESLRERNSRLS